MSEALDAVRRERHGVLRARRRILSGKYARGGGEGRMAGRLDDPRMASAIAAVPALLDLSDRLGEPPAVLAMAFALSNPRVVDDPHRRDAARADRPEPAGARGPRGAGRGRPGRAEVGRGLSAGPTTDSASQIRVRGLHEAPDERQGGVGDLAPAAVDGEGMSSAGDLHDLRHAGVALLRNEISSSGSRPSSVCSPRITCSSTRRPRQAAST